MTAPSRSELGGMELGRLIHSGLVHRLYEADSVGPPRVIGVLQSDLSRVPRLRAAYVDGIRFAASVSHPALVCIDAVAGDDAGAWVVMERIDGESLGQLGARAHALPLGKVLRYARDVLAALAEVHGLGLVHGCIGPGKIIAPPSGRARLLGLGLSAVRRRAIELVHGGVPSVAEAAFMPPEQREGRAVSPQSDLWSVGAVIEALLTGSAPGPLIRRAARTRLAASRIPDCPSSLARLLDRSLASEPADRFASAGAMREMVEEVMLMHGAFSVRVDPSSPGSARGWKRPPTPAPASQVVPTAPRESTMASGPVGVSARTEPSFRRDGAGRPTGDPDEP